MLFLSHFAYDRHQGCDHSEVNDERSGEQASEESNECDSFWALAVATIIHHLCAIAYNLAYVM